MRLKPPNFAAVGFHVAGWMDACQVTKNATVAARGGSVRKQKEPPFGIIRMSMGDNNNSFKKRLTTTVLCAVASVGVSSDLFGGAPYEIPARLFQWERLPACKEVKVTEEDSTETKIIKCPRDGEYYDSRSLRKFDVSKKRIKSVSFTGFVVPGYVLPDITGYVSITVRQGKVTFGYPFDCKFPRANFLGQGIMSNPIDGDYVRYIAAGTNFSAWATFASSDNMIRWHEDGTFARIEFAPQPDVDGDFLYYRMQNTNNQVTIAGGMKSDRKSVV